MLAVLHSICVFVVSRICVRDQQCAWSVQKASDRYLRWQTCPRAFNVIPVRSISSQQMASERSDSLTLVELDNLVMDALNRYFKPTIPQAAKSDQPPLAEMLEQAPEQPVYVRKLVIAYKAFKRYGWIAAARKFRRYAFELGSFDNKEQFAMAMGKSNVHLPELPEREEDLLATERYLEYACERVKEAIAEMKKAGMANDERTKAAEESLRSFRRVKLQAGPEFVGDL